MIDDKVGITEKDATAFAAKLNAWSTTLDAKERTLLHALLKAANAGEPAGSALSVEQLQMVAGGAGGKAPLVQSLSFSFFSKFVGAGGRLPGGLVRS